MNRQLRLAGPLVVILVVLIALAAASCGGSDKPAVCGKRDDLQKSVDNLMNVNPVSDGLDAVRSSLADVQQNLKDLASAAGDQYKPQIQALQTSTAQVATDVKNLAGGDRAAAISALPGNVSTVQSDWKAFTNAVSSACD
jgi:hypothetical protein